MMLLLKKLSFLFALLPLAVANESRVFVHVPANLTRASNGYSHVQGEFGLVNSYTPQSLAEPVVYMSNFCADPKDNKTMEVFGRSFMQDNFILMIDEDVPCKDANRAHLAQLFGASALVMVHKAPCLCDDPDCKDKKDTCLTKPRDIHNDGSAYDIDIPVFMIYSDLGNQLIEDIKNDRPVLLELVWNFKQDLHKRVPTWSFWSHAHDPYVDLEVIIGLKHVQDAFKGAVHFEPSFPILNGEKMWCANTTRCEGLCTNKGKYCSLDDNIISGENIVIESLRRLCIFSHDAKKYWDYWIFHKQECQAQQHRFNDTKCIHAAYKKAGIKEKEIDNCMKESGDIHSYEKNAKLDSAMWRFQRHGVTVLPAITLNTTDIEASPRHLFDALCTEFWFSLDSKIPDICEKCGQCANVLGCLETGKCKGFKNKDRFPDTGNHYEDAKPHHRGRGFLKFMIWMMILGAVGYGGFYAYNHRESFMGSRGNSALLNDYLQLNPEQG